MAWIPLAVGLGAGAVKNVLGNNQAAEERKRQAAMTRYSPWTGMHGTTVKDANLVGDLTQGGMAGAMIGQSINAAAKPPVPVDLTKSSALTAGPMANEVGNVANPIAGSAGALQSSGSGQMLAGSPWGQMGGMPEDPSSMMAIYKQMFQSPLAPQN